MLKDKPLKDEKFLIRLCFFIHTFDDEKTSEISSFTGVSKKIIRNALNNGCEELIRLMENLIKEAFEIKDGGLDKGVSYKLD